MSNLPKDVLNPAQQLVEDHALLDSGFSVVLQMPTGSGKTWLAKQAIRKSLNRGHRAIYLCPLRALADELANEWAQDFPDIPVGVFTGDYGKPGKSLPVPYAKARVLIMTPERLDACTRIWRKHWSWIPEVDWLIVDEIHLLGDANRGSRLEGTISRMRRLNPFCRILGLSATLGNRQELAHWLDGVELKCEWRPVPLEWKKVSYRKAEQKPELLATEISRIYDQGGQSLVFVQSRRRSEQLAQMLRDKGFSCAHHHAGLAHAQRTEVEKSFRKKTTRILVATATLEMGLNLPARQVVLYDLQGFDGLGFSPLPVNTIWQRAGRAGRRGLDHTGEAVLIAPSWDKHSDHYSRGKFEHIRSGISHPEALAEQILAEVHSGMARTLSQLAEVMAASLASHQNQRFKVKETVEEMVEAGMLREEASGDRTILHATRLGRVACRHQLKPNTVLRLRHFLEKHEHFTDFDLLLVAASTADCEPALPVDYEDLENLSEELARQPSRLFEDVINAKELLDVGGKRLLSALKSSLALWRWTILGDAELVADEEGCYPFEVSRLIDSMDRILIATASIRRHLDAPVIDPDDPDGAPEKSATHLRIELLRQKIINGIDGPAASMTLVKGIGSSWARKLNDAGIKNIQDLAQAEVTTLASLPKLSSNRAQAWIEAATQASDVVPPVIHAPGIPTLPPEVEMSIDPYRLRRALDLDVATAQRNQWNISGGSEPRFVSKKEEDYSCSCPDHAKGNTCKHILAVRLHVGDGELRLLVDQMHHETDIPHLDLFSLWFEKN